MSSSMVIESHVAAQRPSQTSNQTLSHHIDTLCYIPCRIVARHWRVAVCVLERSIQADAKHDSPLVTRTAAPYERPNKTKPVRRATVSYCGYEKQLFTTGMFASKTHIRNFVGRQCGLMTKPRSMSRSLQHEANFCIHRSYMW